MKGIFPRIYDSERSKQKDAAPDTDNCFDLTYDENRRFLGDKGRCIDDIFDAIGFGWYQMRLLLIVGIIFACHTAEINLLLYLQGCLQVEWNLSNSVQSLMTSVVFAGEIFGMLTIAPLADIYGRRAIILSGGLLIVVFSFASAVCPNIYYLIVARMFVGLGIGASNTVAYDLFAETVPTAYRNLIAYTSVFVLVGSEYVIFSAYLFLSEYGWRTTTVACSFPILTVVCVGYFYLPESPRWLVSVGEYEKAKLLLQTAAGLNGKTNAVGEIIIIPTKVNAKNYSQLFFGPHICVTLLLWLIWLFTQFAHSCIYFTLIYYFANGSCDFKFGYLALTISLQLLGIIGSINIMNRLGRVSTQMIFFCVASTGIFLYGVISAYSSSQHLLAFSFLLISQIFSLSGVSVLWVHTVELFPTEFRAAGHSSCSIIGKFGAFGAVYWINDYARGSGHVFYGSLFYSLAEVMAVIGIAFLLETTGIPLDNILALTTPAPRQQPITSNKSSSSSTPRRVSFTEDTPPMTPTRQIGNNLLNSNSEDEENEAKNDQVTESDDHHVGKETQSLLGKMRKLKKSLNIFERMRSSSGNSSGGSSNKSKP